MIPRNIPTAIRARIKCLVRPHIQGYLGRGHHSALIANASNSTENTAFEVFSAAMPTDTSSGKSTVNSFAAVHSSSRSTASGELKLAPFVDFTSARKRTLQAWVGVRRDARECEPVFRLETKMGNRRLRPTLFRVRNPAWWYFAWSYCWRRGACRFPWQPPS